MTLRRLAGYGPAFVLLIALLVIWELYVRVGLISSRLLPTPTIVAQSLVANWDAIYSQMLPTLLETVLGIGVATLLGLALGILLDTSVWIRRAVYPLLVTSQTIPLIALAPLFLIWFGYELNEKVIMVTLFCFFPIAVASADGLMSAEPELINLLRSMRASRWQILWLVRLPGAMPAFFSGLRIAVTYSMIGAIVGEWVGGTQGLGYFMQASANSLAINLVFATIFVIVVLSLLLFGLVALIERIALPWYYSAARSIK